MTRRQYCRTHLTDEMVERCGLRKSTKYDAHRAEKFADEHPAFEDVATRPIIILLREKDEAAKNLAISAIEKMEGQREQISEKTIRTLIAEAKKESGHPVRNSDISEKSSSPTGKTLAEKATESESTPQEGAVTKVPVGAIESKTADPPKSINRIATAFFTRPAYCHAGPDGCNQFRQGDKGEFCAALLNYFKDLTEENTCPMEERKQAAEAQDIQVRSGNDPLIKQPPIGSSTIANRENFAKVPKTPPGGARRLSLYERDTLVLNFVKAVLTPKQIEILDDAIKTGEFDSYYDVFCGMIDNLAERMEVTS